MRRLILGTAGHIDHGKTSLVRALTGAETDRLVEEKQRGITIDLGFAELELEDGTAFGIIDVPGHEAFVRNMLAGATGIDLVMLTVAADEGVMPQTREHLAIVELLGVRAGIVALTKTDLVEPEWLELALEDVRDGLRGTPFATSPIVAVSSTTGEGLETLRERLTAVARDVRTRDADDLFRLAVDRVFSVRGTGTVATGTVWSGRIAPEDTVRVLPTGLESRVRGVQVHGQDVERAVAGQRAAIALAGTEREAIRRGDVLVSDPAWQPSSMVTARLHTLDDTGWTIRHRQRVRFHLGSAEVMARIALLDEPSGEVADPGAPTGAPGAGGSAGRADAVVAPGESAWVQLRLEAPVVARAGDRFVIRSYSPVTTIGGGVVVEPVPSKRKRMDSAERGVLETLLSGAPEARIEAAVRASGRRGEPVEALPILTSLPPAAITRSLEELAGEAVMQVEALAFAPEIVDDAQRRVLAALDAFHDEHPLRVGTEREYLRRSVPAPAPTELVEHVLAELSARGAIEAQGALVARTGHAPRLTDAQRAARDRITALVGEGGLTPPTLPELPVELREDPDFWPLLKLLEHEGALVPVSGELYLEHAVLTQLVDEVRSRLRGRGPLGPTEFRAAIPVSRKYLIPILEYLDQAGVTARKGEGRVVV